MLVGKETTFFFHSDKGLQVQCPTKDTMEFFLDGAELSFGVLDSAPLRGSARLIDGDF